MDLVKRKRNSRKESSGPKVNASGIIMTESEVEDEIPDSHYTKPHWPCATTETLLQVCNE